MAKWKLIKEDGYSIIDNEGGAVLGIGAGLEDHIIEQDGYAFKDLNHNGILDPYEDWRLPLDERIQDLAAKLSIEEIAGLMLYSSHQSISLVNPLAALMYPGQDIVDTREHVYDLTEEQKNFLIHDHVRHVLVAMVDDAETAARWNNQAQALVESSGFGIPVNISSDPRNTPSAYAEFNMGSGGNISMWPDHIGLAATFDPETVHRFGQVASREYRAMGIATALSPQVDLATEPRWFRYSGTFGEGTKLATDMARAYCDGFQTSEGDHEITEGWGYDSVNAMVKHWPGGGSGESGRDAHFGYGKYAVYPGDNLEEQLKPFVDGAFKLDGKTGKAAAVMPYYTISYGIDEKYGENVGNSYSKYIINDLLREKYGYDEVVCTDWMITADQGPIATFFGGKCWGVEELSVAERHYKILMAGVDQFGGNNEVQPVLDAYHIGLKEHGEDFMRNRFEQSARRLLRNIFRTGLFENPYLSPDASREEVGNSEYMKLGFDAQLRSLVLLKNKQNVLPLKEKSKVYIPLRHINAGVNWFGIPQEEHDDFPVDKDQIGRYFELTDDPESADAAICFIESPKSDSYREGEGYLPKNLQYRPYEAKTARAVAIAGEDRSYLGKTNFTSNEPDLDMVIETKKKMGEKPVIVVARTQNPFVPAELDPGSDAFLVDFFVETAAVLDIISGKAEPSALLPFQMPADMETVETQLEDVPRDMRPYADECGNVYDFAFGLNWAGVIEDDRVKKYK